MRSPKKLKYSQALATRYKKIFSPPASHTHTHTHTRTDTHKYFEVGGVYTMENNDTNTDYHKFVRLGEQK